ncbi:two-component sensor histidine kinase [Helicobacter monodelphidis]|nr:two-component sensor histidine kinase [Helicobacter sp. 15-1451]
MHANNEHLEAQRKYNQFIATINKIIYYGGNLALIEKYLNELDFQMIDNQKIKEELFSQVAPNFGGIVAKILNDEDSIYILVQTPEKATLYKDSSKESRKNSYILTFMAFFIVIVLYILIIKSLMPLRGLRKSIRKFAQGEQNISCVIPHNDEIGELSREFDNAIKKISALNQSRHLFLRTIMHELKTPITKGRIVAEMVENQTQKERLIFIFMRLNSLIDEFAKIEEMSSKNYKISKQEYPFQEVLDSVFKQLMNDYKQNESIIYPQEDFIVKVDFEMFSLALKNLIDNALKYKSEGSVIIETDANSIIVKNYGQPLLYPINEYFKPFFKDSKNPHSQGLGLGLYIIKNTLEAQGLKFQYAYQDQIHHFIIKGAMVKPKKQINHKKG